MGSSDQLMSSNYISQLAYTLGCKRSHLAWRAFAVVEKNGDLSSLNKQMTGPFRAKLSPKLGFVFTGVRIKYLKKMKDDTDTIYLSL
jgi:hypothetical protein